MATRISNILGVTRSQLEKQGAFDGFVDIDAPFHLDPHLLRSASTPELKQSHARLETHFTKLIMLLEASTQPNDRFFREASKLIQSKELKNMHLGYSRGADSGSGVGPGLADAIALTAKQLVEKGIKNPELFELVGLFEEGVGADRISDMVVRIILPDLLAYSQRVAGKLALKTRVVTCNAEKYAVPIDTTDDKPVILVPKEIIRNLPMALDWSDVDVVCAYNDALRARLNALIGKTWKEAQKKHTKAEIRDAFIKHPDALRDLIRLYTGKTGGQYDFAKDPEGLLAWADIAEDFAKTHPLAFTQKHLKSADDVLRCVTEICEQYADMIENNGLNELLYDGKELKHERFAQLLFYGIADAYCRANNLDLNREPNAGRGPVDFKVSSGYNARVTVEVKYTSNPALVRGFEKQLPDYNKAEKTTYSIYLVLQTTAFSEQVKTLQTAAALGTRLGRRVPQVIVIDARKKPSASKMK